MLMMPVSVLRMQNMLLFPVPVQLAALPVLVLLAVLPVLVLLAALLVLVLLAALLVLVLSVVLLAAVSVLQAVPAALPGSALRNSDRILRLSEQGLCSWGTQ
jgi:hypothetical protein